jgi:hypothetical protein
MSHNCPPVPTTFHPRLEDINDLAVQPSSRRCPLVRRVEYLHRLQKAEVEVVAGYGQNRWCRQTLRRGAARHALLSRPTATDETVSKQHGTAILFAGSGIFTAASLPQAENFAGKISTMTRVLHFSHPCAELEARLRHPHTLMFNHLIAKALDPDESRKLLTQVARDLT